MDRIANPPLFEKEGPGEIFFHSFRRLWAQ